MTTYCKLANAPIVVGIGPVMPFDSSDNVVSAPSPLMYDGSVPVKPLDTSTRLTTGPTPGVVHATPIHVHWWAVVTHPLDDDHPTPPMSRNRFTSTSRSP